MLFFDSLFQASRLITRVGHLIDSCLKAWMNKRIHNCSKRPITICATVKTRLSQRSPIWLQCNATGRQRPMRALRSLNITEKASHQHAQNTTFGIFATAWLFRLTGWFHIHLFLFI